MSAAGPRPLVGVICCRRQVGAEPAQAVIERYLEGVTRHADCAALLVPARPDLMRASEIAGRLDGLFLTGSPSNVAPARFGRADDPGEGPFDEDRDGMSLALIAEMIVRGRPILGVCRGYQELNVAFGGTLRRGLGEPARGLAHHAPDGVPLDAMFAHAHDVTLTPGGVLATALGGARLTVNSVHFQGIDRLGDGLAVEARAEDGLVEAFSADAGDAAVLGVQWHPEWRTEHDPARAAVFRIFGRALRGERATPTNREAAS